jgi:hypothetical protein
MSYHVSNTDEVYELHVKELQAFTTRCHDSIYTVCMATV